MAEQQQQEKTQWPELKGKTYSEAEAAITNDNPNLQVFKVPDGAPVTMDYRQDRVRVFVNDQDVVVSVPMTG
ncbi:uncharacterized protein LOC143298782 [Babylonia areolata]|uniref:uncharacterized protein LOC143298782 n=1 Tax=Babylonia areolata TaxID=304850 RepID=UPI003FD0C890